MKRITHIAKNAWRLEYGGRILNEIIKSDCDFELSYTLNSGKEITISSTNSKGITLGLGDFAQLPFNLQGEQLNIIISGHNEDECYRNVIEILNDV